MEHKIFSCMSALGMCNNQQKMLKVCLHAAMLLVFTEMPVHSWFISSVFKVKIFGNQHPEMLFAF